MKNFGDGDAGRGDILRGGASGMIMQDNPLINESFV